MDIERFESLGYNCEFGFVMRRHGSVRSSLCRWAITGIQPLCDALDNDFKGLYHLPNLSPISKDMLIDKKINMRFHTEMVREHVFVEDYRDIYEREKGKMMYLRKRLQDQLQDPSKIFVFKAHTNLPISRLQSLADRIASRGGANLLYVTTEDRLPLGEVEQRGPNLYYGRLDWYADRIKIQESSPVWDQIIENAYSVIPDPAGSKKTPSERQTG